MSYASPSNAKGYEEMFCSRTGERQKGHADSRFELMLETFAQSRRILFKVSRLMKNVRQNYRDALARYVEVIGHFNEIVFKDQIPAISRPPEGPPTPFQELYGSDLSSLVDSIRSAYEDYTESQLTIADIENESEKLEKMVARPLRICMSRCEVVDSIVKKYKRCESKLKSNEYAKAIGDTRRKQVSNRNVSVNRNAHEDDKLGQLSLKSQAYRNILGTVIPRFLDLQRELLALCINELKIINRNIVDRARVRADLFVELFDSDGRLYSETSSLRLKQDAYIKEFEELVLLLLNPASKDAGEGPASGVSQYVQTPVSQNYTAPCGPEPTDKKIDDGETSSSDASNDADPKNTPDSAQIIDLTNRPLSYVVALHSYVGEEGDLSFERGEKIEVLERTDNTESWWRGRIGDKVGLFPANYVNASVYSSSLEE